MGCNYICIFNINLVKLPLQWGHRWVITTYIFSWCNYFPPTLDQWYIRSCIALHLNHHSQSHLFSIDPCCVLKWDPILDKVYWFVNTKIINCQKIPSEKTPYCAVSIVPVMALHGKVPVQLHLLWRSNLCSTNGWDFKFENLLWIKLQLLVINSNGYKRHMHQNENAVLITKFLSLAALEFVMLTTYSAASDENFIRMTTCPVQYRLCISLEALFLLFSSDNVQNALKSKLIFITLWTIQHSKVKPLYNISSILHPLLCLCQWWAPSDFYYFVSISQSEIELSIVGCHIWLRYTIWVCDKKRIREIMLTLLTCWPLVAYFYCQILAKPTWSFCHG